MYPIDVERFSGRRFGLRPPGSVRDNAENMVEVRLKSRAIDPIPRVVIGDRTLQVARPLVWYEYPPLAISWALLPLGGALGALLGIAATVVGVGVLLRGVTHRG